MYIFFSVGADAPQSPNAEDVPSRSEADRRVLSDGAFEVEFGLMNACPQRTADGLKSLRIPEPVPVQRPVYAAAYLRKRFQVSVFRSLLPCSQHAAAQCFSLYLFSVYRAAVSFSAAVWQGHCAHPAVAGRA